MLVVILSVLVPQSRQNQAMKSRLQELRLEIRNLQKSVTSYQQELDALRGDPTYVEYLLRHKLYYGYKGDRIWLGRPEEK